MQKENTPKARAVARGREPAYPIRNEQIVTRLGEVPSIINMGGFTKREVIAKDAMMGLLASGKGVQDSDDPPEKPAYYEPELIAEAAVQYADALLIELSKGEPDAGN